MNRALPSSRGWAPKPSGPYCFRLPSGSLRSQTPEEPVHRQGNSPTRQGGRAVGYHAGMSIPEMTELPEIAKQALAQFASLSEDEKQAVVENLPEFKAVKPGVWEQPVMHGYLMQCCDCGKVDRVDFRVLKFLNKKGLAQVQGSRYRVQLRAWRTDE